MQTFKGQISKVGFSEGKALNFFDSQRIRGAGQHATSATCVCFMIVQATFLLIMIRLSTL